MKPYTIGKPITLSDLKKAPLLKTRSPRDIALEKVILEAAAASESTVLPFYIAEDDKPATVKLAAKKMVERMELPVNVGVNAAFDERAILFSRGVLSERGNRKS